MARITIDPFTRIEGHLKIEVEVEGGNRLPGGIVFSRSGTADRPITIRGVRVKGRRPLIAGGRDKGGDFSRLTETVRQRVKHVILIGEAAPLLKQAWAGATAMSEAGSLREAVEFAAREAAAGDVVLMSPACASFDMFSDYQDRGRQFKAVVQMLSA